MMDIEHTIFPFPNSHSSQDLKATALKLARKKSWKDLGFDSRVLEEVTPVWPVARDEPADSGLGRGRWISVELEGMI